MSQSQATRDTQAHDAAAVEQVRYLQRLIDHGWPGLHFEPPLEREFRRYSNRENGPYRRSAALVSSLAILLLVAVDQLFLGARLPDNVLLLMVFGIGTPGVLVWWLSAYRWFRVKSLAAFGVLLSHNIVFLVIYAQLTISALAAGDSSHPPYTYEALFFQISFAYFFTGMLLVPSCIIGCGIWLGYMLSQAWVGLPAVALIESGMFLAAMNVAGMMARYVSERSERRQFLSSSLLKALADHDPLTGLLNRRAFGDYFKKAWKQAHARGRSLSIAMLDMDHFKQLNDTQGHAKGDDLLCAVANVLQTTLHHPNDCAARFGGDEFVCLWYGKADASIRDWVHAVQEQLSPVIREHAGNADVSVSIGVAQGCPPSEGDLITHIARADNALYLAKQSGRDCIAIQMRAASQPELIHKNI